MSASSCHGSPSSPGYDLGAVSQPSNSPINKRHTACDMCRQRKLKCNGEKPSCQTCIKLGRACEYTVTHKKSGPQRGYLRKLESRLEHLEMLLTENINTLSNKTTSNKRRSSTNYEDEGDSEGEERDEFVAKKRKQPSLSQSEDIIEIEDQPFQCDKNIESLKNEARHSMSFPGGSVRLFGNHHIEREPTPETRLLPMNVDEPYPSETIVNKLVELYFKYFHPSYPFISKLKFYAYLNMGRLKPYMLYAVLMTGASLADGSLFNLQDQMYRRCVKYLNKAEGQGFGEEIISLSYVQATTLIGIQENRMGCFARAWVTVGKAVKAAHLNNLHDLDSQYVGGQQNLSRQNIFGSGSSPDVNDKLVLDESRRTFWNVYMLDKCCSVGTGWPTAIRESEITTNVPLDNESFDRGIPEKNYAPFNAVLTNCSLHLNGSNSVLGFSILVSYILSQSTTLMMEKNRADDHSPVGYWWTKQKKLSRYISNIAKILPRTMSNSASTPSANHIITSLHALFYTAVLALNRSAILKLKSGDGPFNANEFKIRCHQATSSVVGVMRNCEDLFLVVAHNPCILFCLYMATRSFLTMLEESREALDHGVNGNMAGIGMNEEMTCKVRLQLDFLLAVFKAQRAKMFMAECFYEKIQFDINRSNLFDTNSKLNKVGLNKWNLESSMGHTLVIDSMSDQVNDSVPAQHSRISSISQSPSESLNGTPISTPIPVSVPITVVDTTAHSDLQHRIEVLDDQGVIPGSLPQYPTIPTSQSHVHLTQPPQPLQHQQNNQHNQHQQHHQHQHLQQQYLLHQRHQQLPQHPYAGAGPKYTNSHGGMLVVDELELLLSGPGPGSDVVEWNSMLSLDEMMQASGR